MLIRELLLLIHYCWPSLLLHCALHPLWGFIQITQGEPQKSCSKSITEKVTDYCQQICQCRPPPPLPPPPPPPPPPRLLVVPTPVTTFCPTEETWWPGLVIIIAVCCATLVFLFVVVIICYKLLHINAVPMHRFGVTNLIHGQAFFPTVLFSLTLPPLLQ
uniref:Proline rich membrane anchor 1 n=1 Tax=Sphenodon punctatus TaxID=8508 RepID=A0A8D0G783_SPHPU